MNLMQGLSRRSEERRKAAGRCNTGQILPTEFFRQGCHCRGKAFGIALRTKGDTDVPCPSKLPAAATVLHQAALDSCSVFPTSSDKASYPQCCTRRERHPFTEGETAIHAAREGQEECAETQTPRYHSSLHPNWKSKL